MSRKDKSNKELAELTNMILKLFDASKLTDEDGAKILSGILADLAEENNIDKINLYGKAFKMTISFEFTKAINSNEGISCTKH